MDKTTPFTLIYGNGIGPEVMDATLRVLNSANAKINPEVIELDYNSLIKEDEIKFPDSFWESIKRTKIFLKAPLNESENKYRRIDRFIKAKLSLYKSIFPFHQYIPLTEKQNQNSDILIITYDLTSNPTFQYRQTQNVFHYTTSINVPDVTKIVQETYQIASENNKNKISYIISQNNINLEDELFINTLTKLSKEYPNIKTEFISCKRFFYNLTDNIDNLEIILIQNNLFLLILDFLFRNKNLEGLYSIAQFGEQYSVFQSLQDSMPEIAGKNLANPTGLIMASVLLLNFIGQTETAYKIYNAVLKTIAEGIHTRDIYKEGISKELVGTQEFADAVINRLDYSINNINPLISFPRKYIEENEDIAYVSKENKELIGVDIYLDWIKGTATDLGDMVKKIATENLRLEFISNKGKIVYPNDNIETLYSDQWLCRYLRKDIINVIKQPEITDLMSKLYDTGFEIIKIELLYNFDGKPGYFNIK